MNKIKNIIFDLSEVIIGGYKNFEKYVEKNTEISPKEFDKRRWEVNDLYCEAMRGNITENEYWNIFLSETNWNIDKKILKKLFREYFLIEVPGTMNIIKKLSKNYNLILLSDQVKEVTEDIVKSYKELEIFNKMFFSYQFNMMKKDVGCFEFVINKNNLNPKECLFIDDSKNNIEMAKKAGIDGIIFENAKQLEMELINKGIVF